MRMPVSTVQEITGIHWDTIRRIHKRSMDESAVHKGHSYAACVMDLGNGEVLWVGRGRPEADFAKIFEEFDLERLRGVKAVAMDMNASFSKLVGRFMSWADIVYDRYHMQAQYGKEARRHKSAAERLRRLAEVSESAGKSMKRVS